MTSPSRRLRLRRVVALAVIALLAGGLLVIRMAAGGSSVKVPRGAHAGQIFLHNCTFSTESGHYAADCGTLVVPENRQNPSSRLIALPVTRVHAKTAHPQPPVFYLQGGPGITNMVFPQASRFAANHDVVVVGYRGVDGSVRLDCPEVVSSLTGTSDLLAAKTLHAYSAAFRTCANRLTKHGADLAGYNLVERVDDMEAARAALGYPTINLVSESTGTRTAMIYSWRHPQSLNRSVMLGVNPPGHYMYDPATTDVQLQHYADLCAADAGCRARTPNLTATMRDLSHNLPHRWWFLPIKPGNVRLATFYGFMSTTSAATPLTAPETIDSWTSAAHGDASGMWLLSLLADMSIPTSHVWGDMPATGQLDNEVITRYYAGGGDHGTILGNPLADSIWGAGGVVNAWPHSAEVDQYRTLRPSNVDTLLISGDVDFATPAQFATNELLPTLRHGHQVILKDLGHTDDTWNYEKPAADRLMNTFFDTGHVDQSGYTPRVMDFHASPPQTRIAKIVLASVLGLSVLAIAVLAWLWLRLRRRGGVGTKTGFAARTALAPIVGLGGWCVGVLILLTTWPAQSIAYEPASVLFIAVPTSLAVHLAWVHRAWSRSIKNLALVAAVGGGALGTWLGLHVVTGPFGAVTAAVGAALGANLAVVSYDVVREARRTTAEPTTPADLLASPS
jgi:pimeloyl-ACP methyl ester carboxylesterase